MLFLNIVTSTSRMKTKNGVVKYKKWKNCGVCPCPQVFLFYHWFLHKWSLHKASKCDLCSLQYFSFLCNCNINVFTVWALYNEPVCTTTSVSFSDHIYFPSHTHIKTGTHGKNMTRGRENLVKSSNRQRWHWYSQSSEKLPSSLVQKHCLRMSFFQYCMIWTTVTSKTYKNSSLPLFTSY